MYLEHLCDQSNAFQADVWDLHFPYTPGAVVSADLFFIIAVQIKNSA